jgi:serine/threonine-protein kinase
MFASPASGQPAMIGKYRVLRFLGQGAMGEVYLAQAPVIERVVAVKMLTSAAVDDRERFLQEARVVGALSHPAIVVLHDFGFEGDRPFLVFEYLDGVRLDAWMRDGHALEALLRVAGDVLSALEHAHQRGVLHRDLKPANVQVMRDGRAKLMDFGIAQGPGARLTAAGTVMGTPAYIAPEILEDRGYTAQGDVYAAGLLLYEMLAGTNPFLASSVSATLTRVLTVAPAPLGRLRPDLPVALAAAVMSCLARDPAHRPAGIGPLRAVVDAVRSPGAAGAIATQSVLGLDTARTLRRLAVRRWMKTAVYVGGAAAVAAAVATMPRRVETPAPLPAAPPTTLVAGPVATPAEAAPPSTRSADAVHVPSPVPADTAQAPAAAPSAAPSTGPPRVEVPEVAPPVVFAPPATTSSEAASPIPPAPLLEGVRPRTVRRGAHVTVEVRGAHLRPGLRAAVRRGGQASADVRVTAFAVAGASLARVTVLVGDDAALGPYALVLEDAEGTSTNAVLLEVVL